MYDWPETSASIDRLWELIAANLNEAGIDAPVSLFRGDGIGDTWTDPNLIIGQTCGWPYINRLRGKAVPFARFTYDLPNCPAGDYYSVYIGQSEGDSKFLKDRQTISSAGKIAVNGDDSQSGFRVYREITIDAPADALPKEILLVTGSHRNSVKAVAEGKANIAAIDGIAFELSKQHDKHLTDNVTVIGHSNPVPGLPLITSLDNADKVPLLYKAVDNAVKNLNLEDKNTLFINGMVAAHDSDYEILA